MKVLIYTMAAVIVFLTFTVYQADNDRFSRHQEYIKHTADECAAAAALYYDQDQFGDGYKVFDKEEGNQAIQHLIKNNLKLGDDFHSNSDLFLDSCEYYVYYFDGNGRLTAYKGDRLISSGVDVGLPYLFQEKLTGYQLQINAATVVVTINAGIADYKLKFINDPELIRTSGYEHVD